MGDGDAVWIGSLHRATEIKPRHSAVWVRIAGQWWPGSIHGWYRLDEERWVARLQHEDPSGSPWSRWENYLYEPETIRPRYHETRPPED